MSPPIVPEDLLRIHDEFHALHGQVGVTLRTLCRRASYGGRKGMRAVRRLRAMGWPSEEKADFLAYLKGRYPSEAWSRDP